MLNMFCLSFCLILLELLLFSLFSVVDAVFASRSSGTFWGVIFVHYMRLVL